ncbi:MAG: cellulase family glycosylhydrolase, partial [Chloroflexales bacterium]|nr:cellulase family glycosylhydrolase [Chloroflexales bacterium]
MLPLLVSGAWLRDSAGRALLLRGVNSGGSSKLPATPDGATHLPESLDASRPVSFIGRPFPLDEAHEHLGRLRHWGFNVLRLLTTWEAIEHAGPGRYDEAYLDWFAELVQLAGTYGFYVFVDPHQDAWGRWSGGDGAPHWTYTACGLDPAHFDAAEAAITMQRRLPNGYGRMVWPANYSRFAASTMLTLFFGGSDFAPHFLIAGEPAQEYLQRHYIAAMAQVARRLNGMPHVLGYGALNEPNGGYIGKRLDEL